MQTKRKSLMETVTNTVVGFGVSSALWPLAITPVFHIHPSLAENFAITAVFTVASLLRGYLLRRFYNWLDAPDPATQAARDRLMAQLQERIDAELNNNEERA